MRSAAGSSNSKSPDVPLWASAEASSVDRLQTDAGRRSDQSDSGPDSFRHRDASVVKERQPAAKQVGAVGRASRLEPLLTVAETAAILSVSERTVRRLIASKAIPFVLIGRSVRLRPRDVSRLIAGGGVRND
jgi:excisionase family DNA binding protein